MLINKTFIIIIQYDHPCFYECFNMKRVKGLKS
jgi:hypothetical protein